MGVFNSSLRWIGNQTRHNFIFRETELFDHAHRGNWPSLIARAVSHPHEAFYFDRHGNAALHLACRKQPPVDAILALVRANPNATFMKTVEGLTPLHFACYCGANLDVVHLLIEVCPDAVSMLDRRGRTPLFCTCAGYRTKDKVEILRELLEVDPTVASISDDKRRMPLYLMMDDYAEELEEADRNLKTSRLISSLATCTLGFGKGTNDPLSTLEGIVLERGLEECWKCATLIMRAAYYGTVSDIPNGERVLFVHAAVGLKDCPPKFILLALKVHPEQVTEKDSIGNHPLHIAAASKIYTDGNTDHIVILEVILAMFPAAALIPNNEGKLPLSLAIDSGKTWSAGIRSILRANPPALETVNMNLMRYSIILERVGNDSVNCSILFELVRAKPDIVKGACR